ncbi:MAG TPA: Ku protein [Blastocatellia bacterium]|jgi:DNA end-binding protein Ku|nr:Ku protein [Blastocatellia bacterium]
MRSIWKGHIRFLLVAIPVRIYNALETSERVSLNQLHREDYGPIGYDKRCKKCRNIVSNEEIIKGYQYAPDQYAILEPDDIAKIKLKTTKVIDIVGFVDKAEVSPMLYDAPYFAGPDGEVGAKTYALLTEVLKDSGKVGLGKVVLRDREDFVAVAPQDGGLILYKLRYPKEIRKIDEVPQLTRNADLDPNELKLARTLVDQMVTSISEIDMRDRYNEALKEIIEAKIEGKEVTEFVEEEQPVVDIMTALKESIKQAQRKPMVKATGKAKVEAEAEETKPKKASKRKAS